jgi:hypothetical protein
MKYLLMLFLIIPIISFAETKTPNCSQTETTWTNCIGTKTSENGDSYSGAFLNGAREGFGTWTTKDFKYEGQFKNNNIDGGKGRISFPNGSIYECDEFNPSKDGPLVHGNCLVIEKDKESKVTCFNANCWDVIDQFGNKNDVSFALFFKERDAIIGPKSKSGAILNAKLTELEVTARKWHQAGSQSKAACRAGNRYCQIALNDLSESNQKLIVLAKEFASLWKAQSLNYRKSFINATKDMYTGIYADGAHPNFNVWVTINRKGDLAAILTQALEPGSPRVLY